MSLRSSDPSISTNYDYNKLDHQTALPFQTNDSLMSNFLARAFQQNDQSDSGKIMNNENLDNTACPVFDKNVNYYHEFWRMYLQNEMLISQMKEHVVKTKETQAKISQIEARYHELELNYMSNIKKESAKKKRRKATEIQKNFVCPYEGCQKPYGSDVSLNLHIKLKHSGGNKTEREKLAKMIIEAKLKNKDLPEISLNLPPGFLEGLNIHKILKLKEKKDKDHPEPINAQDIWEDIKLNNVDLSHLLTELDKAIEKDRIKTHSDGSLKGEGHGHDHSDDKTDKGTPEHSAHEDKNESPKSPLNH